jgi:hypothetical protein
MKAAFHLAVRPEIAGQRNPLQQAQKANHDQALKTADVRRDWERLGNNGMMAGGCICVVMPGAGVPIIVASLIIREVARIYDALKQNSTVTRNQATSFSHYRLAGSSPRSSAIEQAPASQMAV